VEVLNQQLSTAEHQHKAALAAVDEHKRQLADAKLALTGMHSGVMGCRMAVEMLMHTV
jgi:hypothetical protein